MSDFKIRNASECESDDVLFWDTVWVQDVAGVSFGGHGDWRLASDETLEPNNQIGLQAYRQIETAIIIQLFTDKYAPEEITLPKGTIDRRGWLGDGFDVRNDLFEDELGSHLWLLERALYDHERTPQEAQRYAEEALYPILASGFVSRFDVQAEGDRLTNSVFLTVIAYSPEGKMIYKRKFEKVWAQAAINPPISNSVVDVSILPQVISNNQIQLENGDGILIEVNGQTDGSILEIEGTERT